MVNFKEVAKMLGLTLGEKFKLDRANSGTYCFTESGLECVCGGEEITINATLGALLMGGVKVVFIPKQGDTYYFFDLGAVQSAKWEGNINNFYHYYAGNCFRTVGEALDNYRELYAKLRKHYEKTLL